MVNILKFDPIPKKIILPLLLFLIILSAALRLIAVSQVPPALYQDESAIGYNAYSILQIGKDEYGTPYPLYFKSFGDYKLPVYIYLTAVSEKVFGLNEFAVRFPSVLAGIFAVIVLFFFVRYLTKNTTLAFLSALVLSLNPANIFFSRAGFEVNLALTFTLAGCYFFVRGASQNRFSLIIASLICFGFSLYSYNVTRLIAPLFLGGLFILYWKKIQVIKTFYKVIIFSLLFIILLPFLLNFFAPSGIFSARLTLLTSADVLAKDLEFRSYLANLPHLYIALFYNKYIYMVFQYVQNIAVILSGDFFFVSGTTQLNQGIGNVGFFYLFDLPFFIVGLVIYYRDKIKAFNIFNYWLIASVLILALSKQVPQATRGYFIILPVVCFSALGMFVFFSFLTKQKNRLLKYALLGIFIIFASYNMQYYFLSYYLRFPFTYEDSWRTEDKALSLYLKENEKKYNHIIIDRNEDFVYTTYLFYTAYPPQKFIDTEKRYADGDLIKATGWGKYSIEELSWKKDLQMPHTLIIADQENVPKYMIVLKKMYDPTTFSVLAINGTIVNSPQNIVKYVLISTDANKNNITLAN